MNGRRKEERKENAGGSEEEGLDARKFTADDVEEILLRNGCLVGSKEEKADRGMQIWLERAATLLGPQAKTLKELEGLLWLVFHYEAGDTIRAPENQIVLMREGAREVIRELANRILQGRDMDSDRFKEILDELKRVTAYRSRELLQPIRLSLVGRAGGGELDRVILLLDVGAKVNFAVAVKSARQRMIEFCAAFE
jgi:hypothetical protein